jgi:NADPH:quinone reductase-like Zn-dependent oxidoreductase
MKAIAHHRFGLPDGLALRDVDKPALTHDGVLVRVRASSVNPAEHFVATGTPYIARPQMGLRRPKEAIPGADFAGTVEAVGSAVTELRRVTRSSAAPAAGPSPSTCASVTPWCPSPPT